MTKKVYIGCGAGFSGDRFDASIPIVEEFKKIVSDNKEIEVIQWNWYPKKK